MSAILGPEQRARQRIDQMLEDSGWQVQAPGSQNDTASLGVALCEFQTTTGPVDYLLFADGRPIGVVEAKAAGTTLSGVEAQAIRYSESLPSFLDQSCLAPSPVIRGRVVISESEKDEAGQLPAPHSIPSRIFAAIQLCCPQVPSAIRVRLFADRNLSIVTGLPLLTDETQRELTACSSLE